MLTGDLSVLIVDDEKANVDLLLRILRRAGILKLSATTNPRQAIDIATDFQPDIVLLDLHMPGFNGLEVMQALRHLRTWTEPFVVILTGDDTPESKARALASGAKDFITKPFDVQEVLLRLKNLGDLRLLHRQLYESNVTLEEKVRARTMELDRARLDILERLGMAAEFRDDATGRHTKRVGRYAAAIARAMNLDEAATTTIARAAPLHDVGKIAIPDRVLLKAGPLDDQEWELMRTHTTIGARLLEGSRSALLDCARNIALTHHERWDGSGYPNALRGDTIPLAGRIVALADFFDALSHDRPYRQRKSRKQVLAMIQHETGAHFDPLVVDAFLTALKART